MRHLEKLGEVGEEGWPVPEEAWTRLASLKDKKTKKTKDKKDKRHSQCLRKLGPGWHLRKTKDKRHCQCLRKLGQGWQSLNDKRQKTLSVPEEAWTRLPISETQKTKKGKIQRHCQCLRKLGPGWHFKQMFRYDLDIFL